MSSVTSPALLPYVLEEKAPLSLRSSPVNASPDIPNSNFVIFGKDGRSDVPVQEFAGSDAKINKLIIFDQMELRIG